MEVVNEMLLKMESVLSKYGPDAIELTGRIVQLEYIGYIIKGIVIILILLSIRSLIISKSRPCDESAEEFIFWFTSVPVFAIGAIIFLDWVCRPLYWMAAFDPKVALAVKALELAGVSK